VSFNKLNLHKNVAKAIEVCGYTNPTPVQQQAIPEILKGKDVVACAQTGTGKTAAFVLPALHHLNSTEHTKQTRILVLTPTRELAGQITKAAGLYGKFSKFNIVSLVGGMSYHHQIRDLQRGADIIVATPGRLMDHIEQRRVNLANIEMLILDEADRMLDMGFIEDVEYIAKLTPRKRQTLLFSATVDKKLATTIRHLLNDPVRIDLSEEKVASPNIEQILYKVSSPQQKARTLKQLLQQDNIYKAIIFTATKIGAERLAEQLRYDDFEAAALHGDLRQNVRNRTVEDLRRGKIQYLVATDVAARGIDIRDITHVINYDLPKFSEDYVHRIGRTGRAGKTGIAISFVLPSDTRHVQAIERYMGQRLKLSQMNANGEVVAAPEDDLRTLPFDRKQRGKSAPRGKDNFRGKPRDKDSFGDKPRGKGGFGGKPRDKDAFGDKPRSASGFRGRSADKEGFGDKPRGKGGFGGKPRDKDAFGDKPRSASGFRGRSADKEGFGDKPRGKGGFGDKPRGKSEYSSRSRDKNNFGDRPRRTDDSKVAPAKKKRNRPAKRDRDSSRGSE